MFYLQFQKKKQIVFLKNENYLENSFWWINDHLKQSDP